MVEAVRLYNSGTDHWPAHQDTAIWEAIGSFIKQKSGVSIQRTG